MLTNTLSFRFLKISHICLNTLYACSNSWFIQQDEDHITFKKKEYYRCFIPSFLRIFKKSVFSDYGLLYSWSKWQFILTQIVSCYWHACKIPHFGMFSWNLFENLPLFKHMRLVQRFGKEDDGVVMTTSCMLWEKMMPNEQLWLFITPRWVMFSKLDRLVWFIITCPSGLHFCCICFWDSIDVSCNDAQMWLPADHHYCGL